MKRLRLEQRPREEESFRTKLECSHQAQWPSHRGCLKHEVCTRSNQISRSRSWPSTAQWLCVFVILQCVMAIFYRMFILLGDICLSVFGFCNVLSLSIAVREQLYSACGMVIFYRKINSMLQLRCMQHAIHIISRLLSLSRTDDYSAPMSSCGNRLAVHLWIKALRQNYQKSIHPQAYLWGLHLMSLGIRWQKTKGS